MALQLPQCLMFRWDIIPTKLLQKVIKEEANVDAVIHCAAWTAVDAVAAEDEENQPKVRLVNVTGTLGYADVCKELDIKMPVSVH